MPENSNFVRPILASNRHNRSQFTGLNRASERRRGDFVRAADLRSTTHVVTGFKEIVGSGERLIDVGFPVSYIEMPMFVSGASLAPGSELVTGEYPSVNAIVAYWSIVQPDQELYGTAQRTFFKGCQLALTATGPESQRIWFNWQFTGMAVANPITGPTAVPTSKQDGTPLT